MKITKILCILLTIIFVISLSACSNSKISGDKTSSIGTGSKIDNEGLLQYDIVPAKPNEVASATHEHKPESGYEYKKEPNVFVPDDDVKAEGFTLTTSDNSTDEPKEIVSVYYEQSNESSLEIDVFLKDSTDKDLDAASKLVKDLLSSCFNSFPVETIKDDLPLSTKSFKSLLTNNAPISEIVYGADTNVSISYEYFPKSQTLIFRVEI